MLVLSRKVGEAIVIDGRITVYVTRVKENVVRLSFEVKGERVRILREEICNQSEKKS